MKLCSKDSDGYFNESDISTCVADQSLANAAQKLKSEFLNVSGDMSSGGGVAIDQTMLPELHVCPGDVLVLTAAHIVDNKKHTFVGSYSSRGELGDLYEGKVIYADRNKDLALLAVSIKDGNQRPASINFYDLRDARPGEHTLAFEVDDERRRVAEFTIRENATYGAIGGAAIRARFPEVSMSDLLRVTVLAQPDAPGTSGSAVLGSDGKVVGLVSQRLPLLSQTGKGDHGPQWVGSVAVSASEIKEFIREANSHSSGAQRGSSWCK